MAESAACGVFCPCGPNGELLGCGFKQGHDGPHAWATLPTFTGGKTEAEQRLEAVAAAWFSFDQQALDALLHEYRKDEDGD